MKVIITSTNQVLGSGVTSIQEHTFVYPDSKEHLEVYDILVCQYCLLLHDIYLCAVYYMII